MFFTATDGFAGPGFIRFARFSAFGQGVVTGLGAAGIGTGLDFLWRIYLRREGELTRRAVEGLTESLAKSFRCTLVFLLGLTRVKSDSTCPQPRHGRGVLR